MFRSLVVAAILIALGLATVFLGSSPRDAQGASSGTIVGRVTLNGTPPPPKTISVNKDSAVCGREKKLADVAVGPQHGLADAVVSVPDAKGTLPASKAVLDQNGCEFHPDVLVMRPGELDILNSDGVLHNIHSFSRVNAPFNKAQPKFRKVLTEEIERPEVIKLQCDVHSWMHGWLFVTDHPAVVTNANGAFKLDVPPGRHTVQVWHPVLGTQSKDVDVKPGQTTELALELAVKK
jgi:hypothetical protein